MPPGRPQPSAEDLAILDPDGQFRSRLLEDRERIAALTVSPSLRPADLQALERIAHQLAGAAGTFGFAEIGDCAITLEDELIALRRGDGGTAGAGRIRQAIAGLRQALQAI
jgi:HPt (histidine-containing phosphotransfer) domain-containing protein